MRHGWYSLAILAGILLLLPALRNIADGHALLQNGRKTIAVVTGVYTAKDNENNNSYMVTYAFVQQNGDTGYIKKRTYAGEEKNSVGQKTVVIYYEDNPGSARLLDYRLFLVAIICLCISLPLLVLGTGYYITWWLVGRRRNHYWR